MSMQIEPESEVGKRCLNAGAHYFRAPSLVKRWRSGEALEAERAEAEKIIENWRRRLIDISWFMRSLNENLARRANIEDHCTGRFWEGRFKSQAVLDEASLLTAMAYVDLNPIRAGIAKTPEDSQFTSIYDRVRLLRSQEREQSQSIPLRSFHDEGQGSTATIPFRLRDYLLLVDWSGRAIRAGKRGFIPADAPPILKRLNIDAEAWEVLMTRRRTLFGRAMGKVDAMRLHAASLGQSRVRGLRNASTLYSG